MQTWLIIFLLTLGAIIIIDGLRQTRHSRRAPQLSAESTTPEAAPKSRPKATTDDRPSPVPASASPVEIMTALSNMANATQQGYVPDVGESLAGASKHRQAAKADVQPLHHALSRACVKALKEERLTLRLIDTSLTWGALQEALRGDRLVYDSENCLYHAGDTEGRPVFSVASAIAPSVLLAPREGDESESVRGLLFLLPAAPAAVRVGHFEQMAAFAYRLKRAGGGRLQDEAGNPATSNTLEFLHEQLLSHARKATLEECRLAKG